MNGIEWVTTTQSYFRIILASPLWRRRCCNVTIQLLTLHTLRETYKSFIQINEWLNWVELEKKLWVFLGTKSANESFVMSLNSNFLSSHFNLIIVSQKWFCLPVTRSLIYNKSLLFRLFHDTISLFRLYHS